MTLDEYERACLVDSMKVIRVAEHKTEYKGLAKLVMEGKDMQRLDLYVDLMHPLQNLFVYPGPKYISGTMHKKLKKLVRAVSSHSN